MGEDMPSSKKRNNGPTELIVNRDRVKCALTAFMGACVALAGALALFAPLAPGQDELSVRLWMGVAGLPLGAAVLLWSLDRLVRRPELLAIDGRGIRDRSNWMSPGEICWDDVSAAYVLEMGANSYLCLELADVEGFSARLNGRQRKLLEANVTTGFAPVRIQLASVPGGHTSEDALAVVRRLHPELVRGKKKVKTGARRGVAAA